MKQIGKDTLCYYCLGCERLSNETIEVIRNCKGFIAGIKNWREMLEKELKKK